MKTIYPTVKWCCLTIIFTALFAFSSLAQTLITDATDYPPGSTVVITGSGFAAGENVSVQVTHNPTCCDDATASDHQPWTVTTAADGGFVTSWYVPSDLDEYGASLIAVANGQSSGAHAEAVFTDGGPVLEKAAPTDQNQVDITCGGTVTVYAHVSTSNQDNTGVAGVALQWNILSNGGHPIHLTFVGTPDAQTDANGDANATVQDNGLFSSGNPGDVECIAPALGNGNGLSITWHVASDCAATVPAPVLTCASGSDLGCYGTSDLIAAPTPVAPAVSGGCAPVGTPTYVDGTAVSTGGCGWSITRTWTVMDNCGQTGTCDQVYTYSQADALAFDNLPTGGDLGCNPTAPSCDLGVTATNQCGQVSADCTTDGPSSTGGCGWTQTFHYHASTSCGADADADVTYTWSAAIALAFDNLPTGGDLGCNPTLPSCATVTATNECGQVNADCTTDGPSSTGSCGWTQTFHYHASTSCGADADADVTYTWSSADVLAFDNLPAGGDLGCNPTPPSCDLSVTATNQCGTVSADCTSDGPASTGGCGWTQTFHYHASTSCGADADADVTYTWSAGSALAFDNLPAGGDLGCNPTLPSCATVTATNECGQVSADCTTDGPSSTGGCGWTQTFHYHASTSCGADADADVTYTWSSAGALAFDNLPAGGYLGCNPTAPSCDASVTATNECGTVSAGCSSTGATSTGNCGRTQTFHYHASTSCGADADADVTYTWNVVTAPVFDNLPAGGAQGCQSLSYAPPSCSTQAITAHNECGAVDASCNADAVVSTGCNKSQTFHYSATDACSGLTSTASRTFTWSVPTTVSLSAPNPLPICGLGGNNLTVSVTGVGSIVSYAWTVSGTGWAITAGNTGSGSATITYTAGASGTQGTFTVTVTNNCGCTSTATVTFGSRCTEGCSYSQGFYSGTGKNCQGKSATGPNGVIATALSQGNLTIGTTGHSITFLTTDASCLGGKLPAGTTPSQLYAGNINGCSNIPNNSNYVSSGKLKSALAGQVIALALSMRNGSNLGSIVVTGPYVTTYKASSCTNGVAVAGTKMVKGPIPASIFTALGSSFTIQALWTAANNALGNGSTNPSLSNWTTALDIINQSFDGCRILAGFGTSSAGVSRPVDEVTVDPAVSSLVVYPNPTKGMTTVEFTPAQDGKVTIELYNMNGSLAKTLFNNSVTAGEIYNVQFETSSLSNGMYFIRTTDGISASFSKLIIMK